MPITKREQAITAFTTPRLIARHWCIDDLAPFSQLNGCATIMKYFPASLSKQQSDELALEIQARIDKNGYGFWAVEEKSSQEFIGFVGLNHPQINTDFTPCLEIGWRLDSKFWGKGYATEAALAALHYAFTNTQEKAVFSFTATVNRPSERVMLRIGMRNTQQNFFHPSVPKDSHLSEHILYRITRACLRSL